MIGLVGFVDRLNELEKKIKRISDCLLGEDAVEVPNESFGRPFIIENGIYFD